LVTQGVPAATATRISHLPAVGSLFASFLGFNPIGSLLGPTLAHLSHAQQAYLTGRAFFPHLISGPFLNGLHEAFDFAFAACALAAVASWLRGGKYIHQEEAPSPVLAFNSPPSAPAELEPEPELPSSDDTGAESGKRSLEPARASDRDGSGDRSAP
ncbi:MAG: MFS transporter, partial [Candidatus Dormiibacterota bacterium]